MEAPAGHPVATAQSCRVEAAERFVKFVGFPARVLFCSLLALACRVFLVVRQPDLLLAVQEWIKQGSVRTFDWTSRDRCWGKEAIGYFMPNQGSDRFPWGRQ